MTYKIYQSNQREWIVLIGLDIEVIFESEELALKYLIAITTKD